MKNNVYIQDVEKYEYNNEKYFNPSTIYPEGLDISVKSDPILYDNMRQGLKINNCLLCQEILRVRAESFLNL